MEKQVIDISWNTLWRVFFFVLFATVFVFGLQIILGLFLAIVISSGVEFIINFLERRGMPRMLGVILIFLLAILALVILTYLVIPFVIADANTIFLKASNSQLGPWVAPLFNLKTTQSLSVFLNKLSLDLFSNGGSPLETFSQILGSVGLAVAVIFSSFYLSLSRDGVERFLRAVLPADKEEEVIRIYERARYKMGSWFRTQILSSFIMGVLAWTSLTILGVKHALLLALLTAIFELVPFVGPILSGGVAVLFAITSSYTLALYTFVVFLLLNQFESHFLIPVLTRRSVGLHPVIVIVSLLIGIQLEGFLGAVIAVPAAAVLQEIVEERSSRKVRVVNAVADE